MTDSDEVSNSSNWPQVRSAPLVTGGTLVAVGGLIALAGVIVGGKHTSEIFIENGRFHGRQIIAAIAGKGKLSEKPPVSPPGE